VALFFISVFYGSSLKDDFNEKVDNRESAFYIKRKESTDKKDYILSN